MKTLIKSTNGVLCTGSLEYYSFGWLGPEVEHQHLCSPTKTKQMTCHKEWNRLSFKRAVQINPADLAFVTKKREKQRWERKREMKERKKEVQRQTQYKNAADETLEYSCVPPSSPSESHKSHKDEKDRWENFLPGNYEWKPFFKWY